MAAIILSGVGGSTNWLPLILPLLAIVLILQFSETIIHFFRRRKLSHHGHITDNADVSVNEGNSSDPGQDYPGL